MLGIRITTSQKHNLLYTEGTYTSQQNCMDLDAMEARQAEGKDWAHVHKLRWALDVHSLKLQVKTANKAEAVCQQRFVVNEVELADSRQKHDDAEDVLGLTDALKAK